MLEPLQKKHKKQLHATLGTTSALFVTNKILMIVPTGIVSVLVILVHFEIQKFPEGHNGFDKSAKSDTNNGLALFRLQSTVELTIFAHHTSVSYIA